MNIQLKERGHQHFGGLHFTATSVMTSSSGGVPLLRATFCTNIKSQKNTFHWRCAGEIHVLHETQYCLGFFFFRVSETFFCFVRYQQFRKRTRPKLWLIIATEKIGKLPVFMFCSRFLFFFLSYNEYSQLAS